MTDERTNEPERRRWARVVLRVAVALLLIIHGVARASLGIVDDFGVFLMSIGLPFGPRSRPPAELRPCSRSHRRIEARC